MSGVIRALVLAALWWIFAGLFALGIWSGGLAMLGGDANTRVAVGIAAALGGLACAFIALHWVVKWMERR
ncbi:MAG: hypothetical protein QM803_16870 [Rhodocyclaceae bacterium]